MKKNNLKLFFRLVGKHWVYYAINVFGLAIGIASFLLVAVYVNYEYSFDKFHTAGSRIYRIASGSSRTPVPLAPIVAQQIAGVESASRLIFPGTTSRLVVVDKGDLFEEKSYYVDSTFFSMFTYPFISGSPASFTSDGTGVVITRRTAEKYFGSTDAVGQTLEFRNNPMSTQEFTVVGVIEDPPPNSQFDFDILLPFSHYNRNRYSDTWNNNLVYSYIQIGSDVHPHDILEGIKAIIGQHTGYSEADLNTFVLQPLTSLHFDNSTSFDFGPHSKRENAWILFAVGVLFLSIACVNFVNLFTARIVDRLKEIGLRTTAGATRAELAGQFLLESVIITSSSFVVAISLVYLSIPFIPGQMTAQLTGDFYSTGHLAFLVLLIPLAIGVVSGLYPAYLFSSVKPNTLLAGQVPGGFKLKSRVVLVSIQFGMTAFLLSSTLVVKAQLDYMSNKDLGFYSDQVLVLEAGRSAGIGKNLETIRQEFSRHAGVVNVSAALTVPGDFAYVMPYSPFQDGNSGQGIESLSGFYVDPDFISNMGIDVVQGRSFSKNQASDTLSFVLNEEALRLFVSTYGDEWQNPIGKNLNYFRNVNSQWEVAKRGTIIGVVRDFNFASLHEPIRPLVIQVDYRLLYKVLVKIRPENVQGTISFLKEQWKTTVPGIPFSYYFLDEQFGSAYEFDRHFKSVFTVISSLSVLTACLGLYGLTLFTTTKRSKEIGIRKVMGASPGNIFLMLGSGFVKPVILPFCVISPLSFWIMNEWLMQFAYRAEVSIMIFLNSGLICVLIAVLTVSYHTISASHVNPLKFLR